MARTWLEQDALWRALAPTFGDAGSAEREADAIVGLTGIAAGDPVVDLACGPGRHALALARRGHPVTAVDLQTVFLTPLARQAEEAKLPIEVVRRDVRQFERKEAFAAACIWGDLLGCTDSPADDRAILQGAARSLRPGGALILQLVPKELAATAFPERTWTALPGDRLLLEEHQLARHWTVVRHTWTLIEPGGRQVFQAVRRLFSASELATLLGDVGFETVEFLGDVDRRSFGRSARTLIAVARR